MLCYKDQAFCSDWRKCKNGETCFRALTSRVIEDAARVGLPMQVMSLRSDCDRWEPKESEDVVN